MEHGVVMDDRGFYDKYFVAKLRGEGEPDCYVTYSDEPPEVCDGLWRKRTGCFVLSYEKDDAYGDASRDAVLAYARSIHRVNRRLAWDLAFLVQQEVEDLELDPVPVIELKEELRKRENHER